MSFPGNDYLITTLALVTYMYSTYINNGNTFNQK